MSSVPSVAHADTHTHSSEAESAACAVAHGTDHRAVADGDIAQKTLVAVFASPVAELLLRYGADLGYRTILLEPDPAASGPDGRTAGDARTTTVGSVADLDATVDDPYTDVVFTDHHRAELAGLLHDLRDRPLRWIGVMGNPRHPAPYLDELTALGASPAAIGRIHRPIGLNIGSRTPAEIAIATLAGLIADRNDRPGGLHF